MHRVSRSHASEVRVVHGGPVLGQALVGGEALIHGWGIEAAEAVLDAAAEDILDAEVLRQKMQFHQHDADMRAMRAVRDRIETVLGAL